MVIRLCPHKLRQNLPCTHECAYKGKYRDPRSGEVYTSCFYSHRRLPEDEDIEADAKSSATVRIPSKEVP